MKPKIFKTAAEFRAWLTRNHDKVQELWLGFYNKRSGRIGITYPEALDEALCFGWIDGVRKSVNETTYVQRFTPRKAQSYWSAVNLRHAERLKKSGRMTEVGLAALENRKKDSGKYSFESRPKEFSPELEERFRTHSSAWEFFNTQAPSYRRTCIFWVVSAKKEETQLKRLETLMRDSASGRRLGLLTPKAKRKS